MRRLYKTYFAVLLTVSVAACGGGGGGSETSTTLPGTGTGTGTTVVQPQSQWDKASWDSPDAKWGILDQGTQYWDRASFK